MLRVGDLAPDFSLPASGGRTVSLGSYREEKALALIFLRHVG